MVRSGGMLSFPLGELKMKVLGSNEFTIAKHKKESERENEKD